MYLLYIHTVYPVPIVNAMQIFRANKTVFWFLNAIGLLVI